MAGTKADDPEKCKEGFLRELAVYEFQLGRMTGVTRANAREVESYAAASEDVERAVTKARGDIAELKSNLDTARLERQHKVRLGCETRLKTHLANPFLNAPSREQNTTTIRSSFASWCFARRLWSLREGGVRDTAAAVHAVPATC